MINNVYGVLYTIVPVYVYFCLLRVFDIFMAFVENRWQSPRLENPIPLAIYSLYVLFVLKFSFLNTFLRTRKHYRSGLFILVRMNTKNVC